MSLPTASSSLISDYLKNYLKIERVDGDKKTPEEVGQYPTFRGQLLKTKGRLNSEIAKHLASAEAYASP
jgi:hypothetical protein